jgi:two-component system cell cycle sensor histidine kinase/response regulator CckA
VSPEPLDDFPGVEPETLAGPSPLAHLGGDARFRVLVEQIRDFAIFLITPDGRHASWNAGVQRVLGYDADEFVGQPMDRIFTPGDRAAGVPHREIEVARTRGRTSDDRWMVKKGGAQFWASGVTTSLWDGGRLIGFGKVLRDLTDQKALQQRVEASEIAVRQNEERLRLALSAARVGTWRVDLCAGTNTLDANLARLLELGERDMAVPLDRFFGRIHADDRERVRAVFERAARQVQPIRTEFRVKCSNGSTRWLRDHGEVIVGPDGEPVYLTGAVADITEQRETGERLREVQRMEAVGKLAGGVAHEVNNMMGVVLGFTEFLLDDYPPGDGRRRDLEQVRDAAGRAATVTAQLLAFSRRQILQPTLVKLSGIIEALRPVLARMLGEDKELVVHAAPDVAYVKADRGQLEQVIINLSLNARDAMGPGGRLVIETQNVTIDPANAPEAGVPSGAYVMLSLSDTGHGMDAATLERIFEPFFTTKPTGQGTGLGLSVVHGIVHQSDGYIRPETAPGQGTTFRVYLPVASSPAERPARTTGPVVMPGHGETVLVAEDEPMVRSHVVRMLDRMGYTTVEAADGREALELLSARAAPVDLVLTDIVMPRLNGRDLATEISARWPDLPVLFMSGYADDEMSRRDLLTPEAPFIQKPFDSRGLAAKLGAMLRRD